MKKGWNITEKVIATILQGWSLFYLYSLTSGIYDRLHFGVNSGKITNEDVKFSEIFSLFHGNYFAGLLALYAGLVLMYDKKSGWVASVISTVLFTGFFLVSGRNILMATKDPHPLLAVSYFVAALVFVIMFILLLQKPFKSKYQPNVANWLGITGVIILMVIDKTVFGLNG